MKAISDNNNRFFIYSDNTKVYENTIPPGYYKIRFDRDLGFFLVKVNDFEAKGNEKIYGNNRDKIIKIIQRYLNSDRNLGVIFSGEKGLGKSLTAKKLSIEMNRQGYPVIIVDQNIQGLTKFLPQLTGNFVILLEEFEKIFPIKMDINEEYAHKNMECQEDFLTIFDSLENDHKLFIITCNSLISISEFYLNRPGRFYYSMKFTYPTTKEIKEYMENNLKPEYLDQIDEILKFSEKALLNYDSLRALAQEINYGSAFKESIKDLNILKLSYDMYFAICVELQTNENTIISAEGDRTVKLDLFKDEIIQLPLRSNADLSYIGSIKFNTSDVKINDKAQYYINLNKVVFETSTKASEKKLKGDIKIKNITFYQRQRNSGFNNEIEHY